MIPQETRDKLVGLPCTLDGQPAKIVGRNEPFPVIVSDTNRVEFSWPTVAYIMQNGGRFKS